MTKQRSRRRSRNVSPNVWPLTGVTVGGFFVGMLVTKLVGNGVPEFTGFLNEDMLQRLSDTVFLPESLLLYLMKRRVTELVFLLLLSMSFIGKTGIDLYLLWISMLQGTFFMTLIQLYAWKGAGLFLVAVFPHCIILVPAVWVLFDLNRKLYTKAYRLKCGGEFIGRKALIRETLFCICMYSAAAWLQSYVNPFLIQKYLHLFLI